MGVWAAVSIHFLFRDHIMNYIEELIKWQNREPQEDEEGRPSSNRDIVKNMYLKHVLLVVVSVVSFFLISIGTFLFVDSKLSPQSDLIIEIKKNWMASKCGKEKGPFDITYGLQNACLNGCGYQAVFASLFVFQVLRHQFQNKFKS